jgi:hypothetical protein
MLEEKINQSKARGLNVSVAESLLKDVKAKIKEIEELIAKGNYTAASQLLPMVKFLIGNTIIALQEAEKGVVKKINLLNCVLIGVGIAAALFLAYLFWPVEVGYKTEKKEYVPKKIIAPDKRLKSIWSIVKFSVERRKTKLDRLKSFIEKLKVKKKKPEEKKEVVETKVIEKEEEIKKAEEEWRKLYEKHKKEKK